MRVARFALLWLALSAVVFAAAPPPKPDKYFNDYAGVVSSGTAARLNRALEDFERQTSSQILVAIFPKLPAGAALEDFTLRAAESWMPGVKEKDNGAILFVFRDDRKIRIEVGYGLEGAIPDSIAKRIIDEEISPRFRRGDFDGGVSAGVTALMRAARGEYRGTGTTLYSRRGRGLAIPLVVILLVFIMIAAFGVRNQGTVYHRRRRNYWGGWGGLGTGGGRSGGGGWSGGGGFSGGGGRFGGGGASGGW